ncbi:MAG: hypothetical protein MUE92_10305, partial [Chloroflexi bacterium]|nr:hypothetical protein [Chloroflexota bacterium]
MRALAVLGWLLVWAGPALGQGVWGRMGAPGAPAARHWHTAVWTGSRMIVWGGYASGAGWLNSGGTFDPEANSWAPMPTGRVRGRHVAEWTGSRMIVWG